MATMTVEQYMATIKRCKNAPANIKWQGNYWPYPQADQSHIAIWLDSQPHEPYEMPKKVLRVPVVNSDVPGALIRVAQDAPTPSEAIELIRQLTDDGKEE